MSSVSWNILFAVGNSVFLPWKCVLRSGYYGKSFCRMVLKKGFPPRGHAEIFNPGEC